MRSNRPAFFEPIPNKISSPILFISNQNEIPHNKVMSSHIANEIVKLLKDQNNKIPLTNNDIATILVKSLSHIDGNGIIAYRLNEVFKFKSSSPVPINFKDRAVISPIISAPSPTPLNTPVIRPKTANKEVPSFEL